MFDKLSYMGTNSREVGAVSRSVSAELRASLGRKNISVRSLAQQHHLPLTTLHKTLNAQRVVDVEDLYEICAALDVDPVALFDIALRAVKAAASTAAPVTPIRTEDLRLVAYETPHDYTQDTDDLYDA